jgi:hypothetical protein
MASRTRTIALDQQAKAELRQILAELDDEPPADSTAPS